MRLSTNFTITECFLILFFVATVLIFSWLAKFATRLGDNTIDSIVDNWNSDFVFDIKTIPKTSSCEKLGEGYGPAFEYEFPGIKSFCRCEKYIKGSNIRNQCKKMHKLEKSCKKYDGLSDKDLQIWKNDRKFCRLDIENENYSQVLQRTLSLKKSTKEGFNLECGKEYLLCGVENKKESQLCVDKKYQKCPITKIWLSSSNPDPKIFTEEAEYSGDIKLWISRNSGFPIAEIDVTEEAMCINKKKMRKTKKRKIPSGILNTEKTDICRTDKRWREIDTSPELDFFQINELNVETLAAANLASKDYEYKLMTRSVIGLNLVCEEESKRFYNTEKNIDGSKAILRYLSYFVYFISIFLLLSSLAFLLTLCLKRSLFWSLRITAVIGLMLFVLAGFALAWIWSGLSSVNIKFLSERDCVDDFSNGEIKAMHDEYIGNAILFAGLGLAIGSVIALIFCCVAGGHNYTMKSKNKNKIENPKDAGVNSEKGDSFGSYSELKEEENVDKKYLKKNADNTVYVDHESEDEGYGRALKYL